jgi:hypothetical protein
MLATPCYNDNVHHVGAGFGQSRREKPKRTKREEEKKKKRSYSTGSWCRIEREMKEEEKKRK